MTWTQRSRQAGGGHRNGKRTNAHRPRAPRKQSLRGWNLGGEFARRGVGKSRVTSYELPVTPKRTTQ